MDRDIEQVGDHGEAYREHRDTAAAAGQVPAEATEAAAKALYEYPETGIWEPLDESRKVKWRDEARIALAAAAPLIAAAQQDVETCDHCGEDKPVAWRYENGEAAVCGDCHEAELLERDRLRAEVDRLTAEVAAFTDAAGKVDAYVNRLTAELTAADNTIARLIAERDAARAVRPAREYAAELHSKLNQELDPGGPR